MKEAFGLSSPVACVKGVGEKAAELLARLGINTVFDLLTHYPRSYEDRQNVKEIADCRDGEKVGINARLAVPVNEIRAKGGLKIYKMIFCDDTGSIEVTAFNQPYLKTSLKSGESYFLFGRVVRSYGKKTMSSPVIEKLQSRSGENSLLPIYRLTEGLTQKKLRNMTASALSLLPENYETLPAAITKDYGLIGFCDAVRKIHYPKDQAEINASRERLIFEELFVLRAGIMRLKAEIEKADAKKRPLVCKNSPDEFVKSLPFILTDAQKRVINECFSDISSGKRMQRLIQGDVGSGKTAVTAAIAYSIAKSGGQTAFMVPTEILASQHYDTLSKFFKGFGLNVALLTGSTPQKEKAAIKAGLESGEIDVCVGTHALLTKDVSFNNLSLVVADEQHRFGVMQRAAITDKGTAPHLIVMSATPIPRTVGLMIYGGLDISVIDELPKGRKKIKTALVHEDKRAAAYGFAAGEIEKGHRIYVVCPAVEDDDGGLTSVTSLFDELKSGYLKKYRLALLHGKMKSKEKDAVMKSFITGETDVLVSTTVIEVGIDCPDATVMIIEDADRFGLSQLHQLRGRVGRGKSESYCVLISSSRNDRTLERLETLRDNDNGFKLMEYDFRERGPGDFFGSRQHGLPELKIADLLIDASLLKKAEEASEKLFAGVYRLNEDEKRYLREAVGKLFSDTSTAIFN